MRCFTHHDAPNFLLGQADVVEIDATIGSGFPVLDPVGAGLGFLRQNQEDGRRFVVDDLLGLVVDGLALSPIGFNLTGLDQLIHAGVAVTHKVAAAVGLTLGKGSPLGLKMADRIKGGVAPVIQVGLAKSVSFR